MASEPSQRSALKDFLSSIATIKGDLSNITAPPFLLAAQSTVEFPSYWAEYPSIFVAPALESDPQKRALLVLKWFLASLKRQQYAGRDESEGVKKPLNAFLGELFIAAWQDEMGDTKLVSEQVSHHPPITACHIWNEKHGIRAEGYACQRITFSGSVNIKQVGHAVIHLEKYDEDYLIPLPNVQVSGLLTGTPYPELKGSYQIVSSTGYVAEIDFTGKRMLGLSGSKNHLHAAVYGPDDKQRKSPIYDIEGAWNDKWVVRDSVNDKEIETFDTHAQKPTALVTPSLENQDPWESRKAWHGVIDALNHGNMQATSDEKSKVEEAQRAKRKQEEADGSTWKPIFFSKEANDPVFEKLANGTGDQHAEDAAHGFWKFNAEAAQSIERPFHGGARPDTV